MMKYVGIKNNSYKLFKPFVFVFLQPQCSFSRVYAKSRNKDHE